MGAVPVWLVGRQDGNPNNLQKILYASRAMVRRLFLVCQGETEQCQRMATEAESYGH